MKKIMLAFLALVLVFAAVMVSISLYDNGLVAPQEEALGVTESSILLGSSLPMTGHVSFFSEYYYGGQAFFDKINEDGGLYGRKIKVKVYDDQYDPAKTVVNTQRLISEDKVFALFNYVGTPTGIKALPLVDEAKVPLVGIGTGANVFRNPVQPYIFNLRASYYQEAEAFIKGVVEDLKMTKVAVFYQFDDYGFDGLKGAEIALAKYGLKPIVTASYQRGSLDVEAAAETISKSNAEAVFMVSVYAPATKFIKTIRTKDYNPVFGNLSFVGSEALAAELGVTGNGVVVTQVVPPQAEKNLLIGVDEYITTMKKYYPEKRPTFSGLEGYLDAKIVAEGLERAGPKPTVEKFIQGLESIRKYSLDIASSVNFSKDNHQGMNRVYLTYIKDGEFILFTDWQEAVNEKNIK
ncbi:ABC transporter substrate-binding protein [Candidatus Falkowbacteria bacterium]|nr:ABC transporter substrate-binding protein [Candidatus Falkowbacteria bacterium]